MSRVVVILMGLGLLASGAWFIFQGAGIMLDERGWTQVIAGSVALGAGAITISIGLLIGEVVGLRSALMARSRAAAIMSALSEPESHEPEPRARPAPAADIPVVPEFGAKARDENALAPEPTRDWISEALAKGPAPIETPVAIPGVEALEEDQGEIPTTIPSRELPVEAPAAIRRVVGRYAFGGVSYALMDNGAIETDAIDGVRRFESLAELRAHIARGSKPTSFNDQLP